MQGKTVVLALAALVGLTLPYPAEARVGILRRNAAVRHAPRFRGSAKARAEQIREQTQTRMVEYGKPVERDLELSARRYPNREDTPSSERD
jgi:hypothetical protein